MNPAELLSSITNRVYHAKDRLPVFLFAIPIFANVFWVINNTLTLLFGYIIFFIKIGLFIDNISKICFFLLGAYMLLLYYKGKRILHAAAGVMIIIRVFLPHGITASYAFGTNLTWLACGLLMVAPLYLGNDKEANEWGKLAAMVAVGVFLFNLIMGIIQSNVLVGGFAAYLIDIVDTACISLELLLLLTCVIHEADSLGGVLDSIGAIVGNITGRSNNQTGAHERSMVHHESKTVSEPTYEQFTLQGSVPQAVSVPRIAPTGGKKQYKTVAGPVGVIVSGKDSYGSGVKQYAAIIDREAVGGWKLESIYEIPVTKKAGCLASLLGKHDETVFFNMLIFSKVE